MKYLSLALLALVGFASVAQAAHESMGGTGRARMASVLDIVRMVREVSPRMVREMDPEDRQELAEMIQKMRSAGVPKRGIFGRRIEVTGPRGGTVSKTGFVGWSKPATDVLRDMDDQGEGDND